MRWGRQFHALSAMGEIDRAILASLDTREIVDTVLARMRDVLPCDCVSVILRKDEAAIAARAYVRDGGAAGKTQEEAMEISPEEIQGLEENTQSLLLTGRDFPQFLAPLARGGMKSALVLPVVLKERVSAIIALGNRTSSVHSPEDVVKVHPVP